MCDKSCIDFGVASLTPDIIKGKRIIEVGSFDFNGSLRYHVLSHEPSEYIGVDLFPGKGVDVICKAEDILGIYGEQSFDIVISTEMMEHVFNWRKVINNFKMICKLGGTILITTRSLGFPLHGWPHDHWRYEVHDMKYIFSDFGEHGKLYVQKDPQNIGVFVKCIKPVKPIDFRMLDLDDYRLYNIVYDLRL